MKCPTREDAVARYGHIDFASRSWHDKDKWMSMLEVSKEWFPEWYVLDTKQPVHAIYCNRDIHMPLLAALKEVHTKGLAHLLHSFDGCFNIRLVRGSNSAFSAHAYGLAVDLNARENPLGSIKHGFFDHPEFVECFKAQGFDWGGDFHSRKDSMHFSFCWE